jgi:hypothetical protein
MRGAALIAALAGLLAACDTDGPVPGVREPCAVGAGPLQECADEPIETPEDACWRLVQCAALPINRPNEDEDCGFCDFRSCVVLLEAMGQDQMELALACVEVATCDQLKSGGESPENPDPPPCFQQGIP